MEWFFTKSHRLWKLVWCHRLHLSKVVLLEDHVPLQLKKKITAQTQSRHTADGNWDCHDPELAPGRTRHQQISHGIMGSRGGRQLAGSERPVGPRSQGNNPSSPGSRVPPAHTYSWDATRAFQPPQQRSPSYPRGCRAFPAGNHVLLVDFFFFSCLAYFDMRKRG